MSKFILKYGLFAGFITACGLLPFAFFDSDAPDYDLGEVVGWTSMILGNCVIVFAMMAYRKQYPDQPFSFKQAMKLGLGIAAIAGAIFVVFDTFYITVINPDFFAQYSAYEISKMAEAGVSQVELDAHAAEMASYAGAAGVVFMEALMFVSVFLIGLVITIISALVFSHKGQTDDPAVIDYNV